MPVYDITARKTHQWAMVALIALGFVLGDSGGWLPVALAGAIMLVGRFWWPADVVRQFVWRVAEARVLGGSVWLVAAALLLSGATLAAWVLAFGIAVMVVLDAALDFCALCFILAQLDARGWLPTAVPHGIDRTVPGER
jgi:hypothetical protein